MNVEPVIPLVPYMWRLLTMACFVFVPLLYSSMWLTSSYHVEPKQDAKQASNSGNNSSNKAPQAQDDEDVEAKRLRRLQVTTINKFRQYFTDYVQYY